MTDYYNVQEKSDPQMVKITNQLQCSKKPEESKTNTFGNNYSKLYELGINFFKSHDIILELNKNGDHCGHDIWIKSEPIHIKGINYPEDFRPFRPLFTNDDFKYLSAIYSLIQDESLKEFWEPLIFPKNPQNPLSQYTERLNTMKKIQSKFSVSETFLDYQTHDPSPNGVFGKYSKHPRTWIPSKDWFNDNLKSLTLDDIFILLPKAERKILSLWIGRVCVGRNNHIPDNSDTPILHTARMAVVLLSKQAGLTY